MNAVLLSSENNDWGTPRALFEGIHARFRFTVDAAAHSRNNRLARYWSPEDSGLLHTWAGERVWLNPPYDDLDNFVGKARHEATAHGTRSALVVLLLPNRPDGWWHAHVERPEGRLLRSWYCPDSRVEWLAWEGLTVGIHRWPSRIPFVRPEGGTGAPFPNVVVIFVPRAEGRKHARPRRAGRWEGEGLAPLDWRAPATF